MKYAHSSHSILQIPNESSFEVFITSGALDEDYPESFHSTLKELNKNEKIFFPDRIAGLGHAVTEPNENYFSLIF
ncbi:MAG: hypothetical protein IPN95_27950 [Bacteroidetes bacterium]|nr:hypothetical protein [Bacteroidota bacterium]